MAGFSAGQIFRQDRDSTVSERHIRCIDLQPCLNRLLQLKPRHGLLELTVGKLRQALLFTVYAYKFLDITIPGLNILITHRPRDAVAISGVCFEILLAPAIGLPAPDQ